MAFAQRERPVMKARALPQQNDRSRAPRPSSLQFCKGVPIPARSICTTRWSRAAVLRWPIAVNGRLVRWRRRVGSRCLLASGSPPGVISVAVRWYLRYGLSYRDVEELLAERGVTVDHVTVYRWVQRFTPEFIEAARLCRHIPGDCWFVDETYVKVSGRWTYLYRAVDQHGQVIDVLLSVRRDLAAARRFFTRALRAGTIPAEVTTDRAPAYPRVLDELIPSALHTVERYANNPVEADHGRLKARLRPMRGLKRRRSARTLAAGHAFVQNLRRGHYELATRHSRPPPDPPRLRAAHHDHLTSEPARVIAVASPPMAHRNTAAEAVGRAGSPRCPPGPGPRRGTRPPGRSPGHVPGRDCNAVRASHMTRVQVILQRCSACCYP